MENYTPSNIEKAVVGLYKIVGMSILTEDQVSMANFMLSHYEQERQARYVQHLQEEARTAFSRGMQSVIKKVEDTIAEFGDQGIETVSSILDEWFHSQGREVEY